MDLADPQQWNAYGYANASPITKSDPTGLAPVSGESASDDSYTGISWTIGDNGKYQASNLEPVAGHNQWGRPITVAKTTKPTPKSNTDWMRWVGVNPGALDTFWNAGKGLAQMAWQCNTLAMAINGGGCGVYDLAELDE